MFSFFQKFKKQKNSDNSDANSELIGISPGGSFIYDHKEQKDRKLSLGGKDISKNIEDREKFYTDKFGNFEQVFHEIVPREPHIDVYPMQISDWPLTFLVSGGMSDAQMNVHSDDKVSAKRVEIFFPIETKIYEENKKLYGEFVRYLASLPHEMNTYFAHGHTVPMTRPGENLFPGMDSYLNTVLFVDAEATGIFDEGYFKGLNIEDEEVNFITPMIIFEKECELKLQSGSQALIELFQKNSVLPYFSGNRKSVV